VYQYFQRRFGINLRSVMWEPDQVPDPARWSELERIRKHHPARWMIWESGPDPETVARLHGLGVESIVVDPAGNRPQTGDFLGIMQQNLTNLQRVFAAD
jgi:zinc transport system substrate-binding protein